MRNLREFLEEHSLNVNNIDVFPSTRAESGFILLDRDNQFVVCNAFPSTPFKPQSINEVIVHSYEYKDGGYVIKAYTSDNDPTYLAQVEWSKTISNNIDLVTRVIEKGAEMSVSDDGFTITINLRTIKRKQINFEL